MKLRGGAFFSTASIAALLVATLTLSIAFAADDEDAAPVAKSAAASKKKFRRSKTTYDETEALADQRNVLLTTGEDKVIDLDFALDAGDKSITVGNPAILVVQPVVIGGERKQVIFKPLKGGETTVTLRTEDGSLRTRFVVKINGTNLLRRKAEIFELLRDIEGLEIKIVGLKIVLDGELLVPADYGRMLQVTTDKSYSDLIINLTTLSPLALVVLAKRMQEDINSFAPNVKTRVVNGLIFLEGTVDNIDQARRSAEVAKLYLPEIKPSSQLANKDQGAAALNRFIIQNFIVINPAAPKKQEKLVRVTVHFVELSKDYRKIFGFSWKPGFTADPSITLGTAVDGSGGAAGTSFSATLSSLLPALASAQDAGYARILKTGTIIVRSGQAAQLNEQTQIPSAPIVGQGGQVAVQPPTAVGLDIAVTPQILGQSEDISLDIELNQVNRTGEAGAGGNPITSNHKIKTKIYVKSSESAALGGVVSDDVSTNFNKFDPKPGGFEGGTSPLWELRRSKSYTKKKSQFVIFVTPQIVENASEGTEDLKKNFRVKVK